MVRVNTEPLNCPVCRGHRGIPQAGAFVLTGGGVVSGLLTAGWGPWRNVGGPICTEALGETGFAGWEEGGGWSVGWGVVETTAAV